MRMVFIEHNSLKSGIFFSHIYSMFFRIHAFQGPGFSSSWFFWVQVFQAPCFSGAGSRVWVQVLEVANVEALPSFFFCLVCTYEMVFCDLVKAYNWWTCTAVGWHATRVLFRKKEKLLHFSLRTFKGKITKH